ncbi:PQQ-dependent sugar dehydrogenase [Pseudidiomarina homiensis]|uniref:PQQ-dependent sugar dehydrogenase n=1 Tax=Pseudidiomarina homiensis TaxID=364198 RepID=UPI00215B109E|nr:PQQ-dependent sugar dehydrogenase [Pseudidiomarina homiensis]
MIKSFFLVLVITFANVGICQTADNEAFQVEVVTDGLSFPWSLQELPEQRAGWLVTERGGRLIHVADDGSVNAIPLQLPELFVAGQSGLFDVILAPDFVQTREFYVSYSCGSINANTTCLARAKLSLNPPYTTSEVQQIFVAQPLRKGAAHYGGRMAWLPDDTLLLTLGDGFDYREQAQNLANHLGKVVRLQRDGSAVSDGPFPTKADGFIFSYGHRNSQGIVYDAQRKTIWQHEHGPKGGDEINQLQAGKNYGWPIASYGVDYTGAMVTPYQELPGVTPPLHQWTPSLAPSDMALYAGQLFADWQGDLLVTHLAGKRLQRLRLVDGLWQVMSEHAFANSSRLRAVAVARDGAIWLATDAENGQLLKLTPKGR